MNNSDNYKAHLVGCEAAATANLSTYTGSVQDDIDLRLRVQEQAYIAITGVSVPLSAYQLRTCD